MLCEVSEYLVSRAGQAADRVGRAERQGVEGNLDAAGRSCNGYAL
jgi:hypothetical protein